MQDIFIVKSSSYTLREANNLQHYRPNQVTFGSNSLQSLGPQTWNELPNDMKLAENLNIFKTMLKIGRVQGAKAMYVNMHLENNFLSDR